MNKNHLCHEKSPYLLQHQSNPVNWYPWGEEAFSAARAQDKPIFLSIGYSTCYWCHVMEKESFENEEVAKLLNNSFISIKVDREERPDIDSIYMNVVVALNGHGGWPMSVFLTPSLKPFYGGTYYPREHFKILLDKIAETWSKQKEMVINSAEQITAATISEKQKNNPVALDSKIFETTLNQLTKNFDPEYGGFSPAPKFPHSSTISLLLRIYSQNNQPQTLNMALTTLERMAKGGLFDHLGGGFHRYSTDKKWLIPHFEKMLYDNAQLALTYLEAYQLTKNKLFSAVAEETLNYVLSEMTHPEGGFYSAQDAGEVGKEGEFYVWKEEELRSLLDKSEFTELERLFGITPAGNFEHDTNILNLNYELDWQEKSSHLTISACKKLLAARNKRNKPYTDDKILTSWNGLMISAFAKGYQVLGQSKYLQAAENAAKFIEDKLYQSGRLLRRYREQDARFSAYLDDYAFYIQGLINLYESSFSEYPLRLAVKLQTEMDNLFWDKSSAGYFFTSGEDNSLIQRQKNYSDGAEPSGNAIALQNLLRLYSLTFEKEYQLKSEKLFQALSAELIQYPAAFSSTLIALDYKLSRPKEIVIIGDFSNEKAQSFIKRIYNTFIPNKVIACGAPAELDDKNALAVFRGKKQLGNITFYICEEGSCKMPTMDVEQAFKETIRDYK